MVSETGTSSRLPPLGPVPPFANPLLLVVTEAHLLHVYSLSPYAKAPVPMRAPLLQPIDPIQQPADPESVGKIGGDRVCVKAAIGLCYQCDFPPFVTSALAHCCRCRDPDRNAVGVAPFPNLNTNVPELDGSRTSGPWPTSVLRSPLRAGMGVVGRGTDDLPL